MSRENFYDRSLAVWSRVAVLWRVVVYKMASNVDAEMALLLVLLLRRRRRRMRACNRTIWTKGWIQRRQIQGAYSNLIHELDSEDPEMFRQYHRLDIDSFRSVLAMVGPLITNLYSWNRMTARHIDKESPAIVGLICPQWIFRSTIGSPFPQRPREPGTFFIGHSISVTASRDRPKAIWRADV